MFKRSEEQEWSRFRGALAKDRDDANATLTSSAPDATDTAAAGATAAPGVTTPTGPGPSFRPSTGDVNVGLPASTRLSRGVASDGADVESLIGERTTFEGTLRTEGAIRLLGTIQGEIHSKGTIYVEERARVNARLTGAAVTVAGHVDGQIFCEGRVEIRPTGHVTGEINAGALIVQEGAYFDGNSKMATGGTEASGASGTSGASSPSSAASSRGGAASDS